MIQITDMKKMKQGILLQKNAVAAMKYLEPCL